MLRIFCVIFLFLISSCLLNNNQNTPERPTLLEESASELTSPLDTALNSINTNQTETPSNLNPIQTAAPKGSIRLGVREELVWDKLLDILISDYNLQIVNRADGIITTEWGSFYQKDQIYRNKLSIRVKRAGWSYTDITVINNVEKLEGGYEGTTLGALWVPRKDPIDEKSRIISNLMLSLGYHPTSSPQATILKD